VNPVSSTSLYISNIHAVHGTGRWSLGPRVDLMIGFHRVQDSGDGRSNPGQPQTAATDPAAATVFRAVQTFPLRYQSPLGNLSVQLHSKVRWNFGYQYYDYGEEFSSIFRYGAHTGFTSIMWSF
jgi:hypothetical protein